MTGNALGDDIANDAQRSLENDKKLERYDVQIDSVKGKGYALCEPLILLDANKI